MRFFGGAENAGLEIAGLENPGPNDSGGKCGTGKRGTNKVLALVALAEAKSLALVLVNISGSS